MAYRKLGVDNQHRRAMLANLVIELIMHESIKTTEARAKEARKFLDRMVTYGKKGTVEARRDCAAFLMNNKEATKKVFDDLAIRYKDRDGGYTRILKLDERRGDDALIVIIELV